MSERPRRKAAAILTLGCKLNIADSEVMARRLREAGWDVVDRVNQAADAFIVNTCSVTHVADQKSRHLMRVARRAAPDATLALTGCLLETAPPESLTALGADLVYRQPDQLALADRLIELHASPPPPSPEARTADLPLPRGDGWGEGVRPGAPTLLRGATPNRYPAARTHSPPPGNEPAGAGGLPAPGVTHTRAFIAVQEGCNDVCAFCIIPKTRGRERSKTVAWVVEEAQKREAEGVREVVITGTQLGHYGSDIGVSLSDLMSALLRETGIPRIRMSSVQPQDLDGALIDLWQDPRLCRHYHLALQSGSEGVLRRMRRRYTRDEYRHAVHRLREAVPAIAITTDVIAGFPGETDAEFEECYDFCAEMAFAAIHVFPYSQRSGTVAYKLPGQVPDGVKKQRVRRLIDLASGMSVAYRQRFLGETADVLWETRRDSNEWAGLTDTYLRVRAASDGELANRLMPARIVALTEDGLKGEVMA